MKKRALNPNTYTSKERNMYLLGMLGQNMIYNIIGTGLVFYFQSVIFIPAMAISVIFAVARVWDAINDPMMGNIVDKTRSKWGKCRPYLMFIPALVCIITILTFVNDFYSTGNTMGKNVLIIGWAAISYILWGMSYTVGDIPLWGITALMTDDEKDRSNILALARIAGAVGGGIVLAAIIPVSQSVGKALTEAVGNDLRATQYGFIIVAVVLTIISTLLFQCASYTKERVPQSEKHYTLKENFKLMWSNKPFRKILVSGILRSPFQLLMLIAMTLLSYYYGNNGNTNYTLYLLVLGAAIFGGQFIAMAFAPKLATVYEKKRVFNICNVVSGIPFFLLFVVYLIAPTQLDQPIWLAVLFVLFAAAGAGTGAVNVLQSVMIADCIDYEEYHHGIRPDGVFFSGQSFVTKLSAGIASIIQGIVFAIVGFSGDGVKAVNVALNNGAIFKEAYPKFSMAMFFLVSIPPAIGCLLSIIPTWKYPLTNKEHRRMMDELKLRRLAAEENGVAIDHVTTDDVKEVAEEVGIQLDEFGNPPDSKE